MKKILAILILMTSCIFDSDLGVYKTMEGDYEDKVLEKMKTNTIDQFREEDIFPEIVEYKVFNQYILVKQIPNKSSHQNFLYFIINDFMYFQDTVSANRYVDSILNNNQHYKEVFSREENFYILEKQLGLMYGPYDYETYLKTKNDLKIPKDVKMDCEE